VLTLDHTRVMPRSRYITQTTLSVDDTKEVIAALRELRPTWSGPRRVTSATLRRIGRRRCVSLPSWWI